MIRPAYWTDADLHLRLTAEQREFYIGLWMLADDAGYVAWDAERVGAELYPYKTAAWRRRLPAWLEALGPQHARLLSCGVHVVVPNLTKFQNPPRPSSQVERAHVATCPHVAPPGTSLPQLAPPGTSTGVLIGKGREGDRDRGAAAQTENGAPSEFRQRVPRP